MTPVQERFAQTSLVSWRMEGTCVAVQNYQPLLAVWNSSLTIYYVVLIWPCSTTSSDSWVHHMQVTMTSFKPRWHANTPRWRFPSPSASFSSWASSAKTWELTTSTVPALRARTLSPSTSTTPRDTVAPLYRSLKQNQIMHLLNSQVFTVGFNKTQKDTFLSAAQHRSKIPCWLCSMIRFLV